jgi:type I restriction enzyme R subunit
LKREKLVLDWRLKQQARAEVKETIAEIFDKSLPTTYTKELYEEKCELTYKHIYSSYIDARHSIYNQAA